MPVASAAVTLVADTTTPLTAPITPSVGQAWQCRLDNYSWFALNINVQGATHWLAPNSSVTVGARGGPAEISVTVISQVGQAIAGVTPILGATWAVAPDTVPAVGGWGGSSPFGYLTRDEFFWPSISGETFPPVLGNVAYSQLLSRPSYHANGAGTGTVSFPNTPRVSPVSGLSTLTLSGFVLNAGIATFSNGQGMAFSFGQPPSFTGGAAGFTWTAGPTVGWKLIKGVNGNRYQFVTITLAGAQSTFDSGITAASTLRWDEFIITILPDGSITMQLAPQDGSDPGALLTDSRAVWTPGSASNSGLSATWAQSAITGGGDPNAHLSQYRMAYS